MEKHRRTLEPLEISLNYSAVIKIIIVKTIEYDLFTINSGHPRRKVNPRINTYLKRMCSCSRCVYML